jgi:hypothetical protein
LPGADCWPSLTGMWGTNGAPPIGTGKFKYVKPYGRWYSMTTLAAAQLQAAPPPVDLPGIAP